MPAEKAGPSWPIGSIPSILPVQEHALTAPSISKPKRVEQRRPALSYLGLKSQKIYG